MSAVGLYRTFHQFEPSDIGEFHAEFHIPEIGTHVGRASRMFYRSDKLNPETGEDEGCVDYVHDYGPRIRVLRFGKQTHGLEKPVPRWLRGEVELVLIGSCLGFSYVTHAGEAVEAKTTRPYPDWYASRCGRALLVVSQRRTLEAILVGGELRVTALGVVG